MTGTVVAALISVCAAEPALAEKPRYHKFDAALNQLLLKRAAGGPDAARIAAETRESIRQLKLIEFEEGRVGVTIRFRGSGEGIARFLARHGGHIAYRFEGAIEAYLDPASLSDLHALTEADRVEAIRRPVPQATSQGVGVHNAGPWHAAGYTGQAVKVGIVDVGFMGWSSLPLADTPSVAGVRCYTAGGSYTETTNPSSCQNASNHGTAVAETLHDVAPAATFYLADIVSPGDFHSAVSWMTQQGVRVINVSLSFDWDGPGDGTSPFADSPLEAVDAAVAGGAVVTISNGNYGTAAWFGPWQDGNADHYLEFRSTDRFACVNAGASATISLELRWQDTCTGASRDLDLELWNDSSKMKVDSSEDVQSGLSGHVPHESLHYVTPASGRYCAAVTWTSGATPSWIQLLVVTGQSLDVANAVGSVVSPAETSNAGALAVGAANWQTPGTIESFSSRGPTPDGRVKPDLVGVDGADTFIYGANGFGGTSQAAAHIAGLAALVAQAFPEMAPSQIATTLKNWALERSGAGTPDNTWGHGLAYLAPVHTLTVSKAGSGSGTVTSLDSRVNCGSDCVAVYASGTLVQLAAETALGSVFAGWSGGGCAGTAACTVTMAGAAEVTATFVATTSAPSFADAPLQPGITVVKLLHLTELREAIETLRTRHGLTAAVWTDPDPVASVTVVKAAHLNELRTALNQVYTAAGQTPPAYTRPVISGQATIIAAVDITELRAAVVSIW